VPSRCPDGFVVDRAKQSCDLVPCAPGQQRASDGAHCCWPGQVWAPGQNRCVGIPQCPPGAVPTESGCVAIDPMAALPGGTFKTGRGNMATVGAFHIDLTEVTVSAYSGCVSSGRCTPPPPGDLCNYGRADRANHPINCVDWNQAVAYCSAQGKRLPTEDEWEWAATGARATKFPWGNEEPTGQLCWRRLDNRAGTCAVGSFPAGNTPQGVRDLSGNVWEWTSSANGGDRIFHGGAWGRSAAEEFTAGARGWRPPTFRALDVGFRCAR
jgi:formylglycine-generating enzyme required for sulfatase activity